MAAKYDIDPNRKYSIAIVGGGVGGLLTAIGLLNQGILVEIYEAATAFSEIGAGVAFGPNALRAMKLIDPAIALDLDRLSTDNGPPSNEHIWFPFRRGEQRTDTSTDTDPNADDDPANTHLFDTYCDPNSSASVHRAHFLACLTARIPPSRTHFGKRLERVADDGTHVVLSFADGTTAAHDAVIGCDGVRSRVRSAVLGPGHPATEPTFSGKYALRGLMPMPDAVAALGEELARNPQLYVGHGGHVVTFPIERGATMNVVVYGTRPADGNGREGEADPTAAWVQPVDRAAMRRDFAGWIAPVRRILGLMRNPDTWALFDLPPAPTYCKHRVCVLGDAAHATTPHHGAGAGQAVEDALIMSRAMQLAYESRDLPRAFAAYDRVRRPRSQRLVTSSREAGLLYDLQDPEVGDDIEKLKQKASTNKMWLWDYHFEEDIEQVHRLFNDQMLQP